MGERGTYLVLKAGKCITVIARERSQKKTSIKPRQDGPCHAFGCFATFINPFALNFVFTNLKGDLRHYGRELSEEKEWLWFWRIGTTSTVFFRNHRFIVKSIPYIFVKDTF